MTLRTPLHALHVELDARMVDFAGWSMPVSYPLGLMGEHAAAREAAALFDVSHMCQVELRGQDLAAALERLVPSDIAGLEPGNARYTLFTDDQGGILDDLIVTNAGDHLYVVVNAARRDHDLGHLRTGLPGIEVTERDDLALLALQGPAAEKALATLTPDGTALSFMTSATTTIMGQPARVSRLGYTGEDGYEISVPAEIAERVARHLIDLSPVEPAGLGARDTLRMEAGLSLYGQDIDTTTTPLEAGLGFTIPKRRRAAMDFPGAAAALAPPTRKLVGIRPTGRAPARGGTPVAASGTDAQIGSVTSGGFSPTLGVPISIGYVAIDHAKPGTLVDLIIRGKPAPAQVCALPFVPHTYKR